MKKKGKGIAATWYSTGMLSTSNPSGATVTVKLDGSVVLLVGATEIGQGAHTVLTQIAAEALGVQFEDITCSSVDTEKVPFDAGQVASRTTFYVGNAVKRAAEQVKQELIITAASVLGVPEGSLMAEEGRIFVIDEQDLGISFAEAARKTHYERRIITSKTVSFHADVKPLDWSTGQGCPSAAFSFGTTIAEVEVDIDTGEVEVLQLVVVYDCGRCINPLGVEGQIKGGSIMGYGYGLLEDIHPLGGVEGQACSFIEYFLPTALDVPKEVRVSILETPDPNGPYGAKGVGEFTMNSAAPAIANAVYDAIGIQIKKLPITPEKVLQALGKGEVSNA